MQRPWSALICALGLVDASQKFPQLKHVRRDGPPVYNITIPSNSTTSTTSTSVLILFTGVTTPPALPTSPPNDPPIYQNTSTTETTDDLSCLGSVTYLNSVPPTVYVTTTESVFLTVSAGNVSVPPPEFTTPPVACTATVALTDTPEPFASLESSTVNTDCPIGNCFPGTAAASTTALLSFQPALTIVTVSLAGASSKNSPFQPQAATGAPEPSASAAPAAGSAFTSTVLVTKKTTVPVVAPQTSNNPPVFQIPATTKNPTTAKPNAVQPTPVQTGSIINSIINNPFTPVTTNAGKVPATATIDSVPVQILPSSVVIGGQIISIPATSATTTLQVNGQTFTVQNSQIIAPGTTYALTPDRNQQSGPTATPSPVTAGGLTFSVGASQAIISGTTYAIGNGAGSSTTLRIGSQTVVLGSSGVILPSTTVAPVMITAAPLAPEIITAAGLTFTVGPSYAIISGSTYTIGPGAKATSIVVGGKTVSLGGNGIGLATTTIAPEPYFSVITIGGMTISVDSSEAILKGTTYKIGKGAPTETTMVNGKTISLGPGGVGLQTTTIPPETAPTPTGGAEILSTSGWCALSALLVGLTTFFN